MVVLARRASRPIGSRPAGCVRASRPSPPRRGRALLLGWLGAATLAAAIPADPQHERGALRGRIVREVEGSQWALGEDHQGRIYVSGNHGISVFDGQGWERLPLPDAGEIRGLATDAAGRVWVGSVAELGYFSRHADGSAQFTSVRADLPPAARDHGQIWAAHAVADAVFFVADQSVLRWRHGQFTHWPLPSIRRLFSAQMGGHVYVHARGTSGLWRFGAADSQPTLVGAAAEIDRVAIGAGIISLLPEADGSLLLLCATTGIYRLTVSGRVEIAGWPSHAFLAQNQIESACRLSDGRIALGTWRAGVILTDPAGQPVAQISESRDGLPDDRINQVFLASRHRLWIATRLGLAEWDIDPAATYLNRRHGLGGDVSGFARYQDRLYVATDLHLHELQPGPHPAAAARLAKVTLAVHPEPAYPKIASFLQQPEVHGRDFVFAEVDGVWRARDGRFDQLATSAPLSNASKGTTGYARLTPSCQVITAAAGVFAYHPDPEQEWRLFSYTPLPQSRQVLPEPGRADTVLVRTFFQDIWRLTLPADSGAGSPPAELHRVLARADSREIHCYFAADQAIYAFTANGTWRLPPGAPAFVRAEPARTDPWIWAGAGAEPGLGWKIRRLAAPDKAADNTTLYALHRARRHATVGWLADAEPSLLFSEIGTFRQALADPDGVLWLGGSAGIVRVETTRLPPNAERLPPPPLWRSVRSRGLRLALPARGSLVLPAGADLAVEWCTPSVDSFQPHYFQTKLTGLDDTWSSPAPGNWRNLERLRPGHYTLEVRSRSRLGQVSPAVTLAFTLEPPWYQTPGALVLWFGLGAGGIYGVVALRTRELRRRHRVLEAAVARRTNELLATKDVLQQVSSAKTEFISTVSHELRNPLTGARMMADVLLAGSLEEPARTRVLRLHGCLKYLQQMLDETLDLSRIELGQVRYRLSRFRLGQLIADTVAMFEAVAAEKGLAYRTDLGRWENCWYRTESTHLQRVLINYLSNALKFTPQGAITFTVTAAAGGPAGFETLRFTVTDTGAGVAPVLQERLFRAFVRHHDPEHQGDAPGTGLGLALCRKLADLSGGKVGFHSPPGAGAAFWVEWPLLPAAADPDEALAGELDFTPLRVLVVEDDPIQLEATVLLLQELGVAAATAPSVDAAESQLRAQPFNVVLADYNLGGATGLDLIARCRTLPHFKVASPRFHLVTAHSSETVRASAHAAGFHGFHPKPISLPELHAILSAALPP